MKVNQTSAGRFALAAFSTFTFHPTTTLAQGSLTPQGTWPVRKRTLWFVSVSSLLLGIAIHSHAAPLQFNGYYNGGRLIYDPNTDLTWYQPAYSSAGCVWTDALNWVANLNIGGVTGWQLPSIAPLTPADLDGTGATIQTGQNNMATYWTQYATQYADLPHEQERSPIPLFYILLIFNTL